MSEKRTIEQISDNNIDPDKIPSSAKRKQYERKVPTKLFHDARFSPWLGISKQNPSKAFCKICSHELSGSVTQIERHKNTSKHIQKTNKQATRVTDFMQSGSSSSAQLSEVASAELELWSFVAEHNLPIALLDHLPGLISNVCKDSKIAKDVKSARSKGTSISKNVVAPSYWNELVFQLQKNKGLILGVYEDESKEKPFLLSKASEVFDEKCNGRLSEKLRLFGKSFKKGKSHLLFGLDEEFPLVSVVNVGKKGQGFNELEERDEGRENLRTAIAKGTLQLRDADQTVVLVDPCEDAMASAEGCHLSVHKYDELKPIDKRKPKMDLSCYMEHLNNEERTQVEADWQLGSIYSESQNFARLLMEMPANILTPTKFADMVTEKLSGLCQVTVRDQSWAESQKMGAFLSVSRGSLEPLRFLELSYYGRDESQPPIALVGKGITFDAGGISLKPSADMDKMRADMGGAACVVGTFLGVTKLQLPINLKAFIPLCENMPSGTATKPGDVVTAMNGKTIQVDNTDAEGRLILADALCYASSFNPQFILDMATLTGAMGVALGSAAAGTFTNSSALWNLLHKAGGQTGDRLWRMPLFQHYTSQMTSSQLAALNNIGNSRAGGSCTAAAFLKEFVGENQWIHIDIAGVMMNKDEVPYLCGGMAGRPTRTVIEFLKLFIAQEIES